MDITFRILIAICFVLLFVVIAPICDATSGGIIIFERKNVIGIDVGHVGVAFKNPNDGTWIGGAVEATTDTWSNIKGIRSSQYNGGWSSRVGIFKTQEDAITEFSTDRITETDGIIPHAAYDRMKFMAVQDPHYNEALLAVQRFPDRGFGVWTNNDCISAVYDVMNAYNLEGLKAPGWLAHPKDYFNDLNGVELPLTHRQQKEPSTSQPAAVAGSSNTGVRKEGTSTKSGKMVYRDFYSIGGCNPRDPSGSISQPPVPRYLPDPSTGTISGVLNTY
jgi:hypothetical protein